MDNPYKLISVLGFVIFIAGLTLLILNLHKNNEIIFTASEQAYRVVDDSKLSDGVKEGLIKGFNRESEIAAGNIKSMPIFSAIICVIGGVLMWFGFNVWFKKIYPLEKKIRIAEFRKLRAETRTLNKALKRN